MQYTENLTKEIQILVPVVSPNHSQTPSEWPMPRIRIIGVLLDPASLWRIYSAAIGGS